MTTDTPQFDLFLGEREKAASAFVAGDSALLDRIVARHSPASFFGPGGGVVRGAGEVAARYELDAGLFAPEGESRFEVFEAAAGDDVAYWSGLQHARVRMGGSLEPTAMVLRVTEVFRREGHAWKLVHRHADTLV